LALLNTLPDTAQRTRQELALQISLGHALGAVAGHCIPEYGAIYARAQVLCEQIGEPTQHFAVLNALREYHSIRAEWTMARGVAEEMLRLAYQQPDTTLCVAAHRALGNTLIWLGEFAPARLHLEQGIA
jgi:predicted ATPase